MKTWQAIILGCMLSLSLIGIIFLVAAPPQGKPIELQPVPTASPIVVFVSGAVNKPGLYSLPLESRLNDAIMAAGGFTSLANKEAVNLAAHIGDGQKIYVPIVGEIVPTETISAQAPDQNSRAISIPTPTIDHLININTAAKEELDLLPGIGAQKAEEIIAYRTQHGPFSKIEDLQNVAGIGPTIFDRIKTLITVSN
jgi:competence protein ComEA